MEHSGNLDFDKNSNIQSDQGRSQFDFLNTNPIVGENYYRIKLLFKDCRSEYSSLNSIEFPKNKENLKVFPNPTSDQFIIQSDTEYEIQDRLLI